jgi:periplasmic protein TonB
MELSISPTQNLDMEIGSQQRFQFCVIIVALMHLLIIFGITVKSPLEMARNWIAPVLEITLSTTPSAIAPEKASLIAPQHQLSSSPKDSDQSPKTQNQAVFPDHQIQEIWQPLQPEARVSEPVEEKKIITAKESTEKISEADISEQKPNANIMSSEQVMASQRISSLMAELADQKHHYAKLPRKRTVTAAAHAREDAEYLFNWQTRVEKIGNLNYPSDAKRLKLQGDVIMMVAVNSDGSLYDMKIIQSSGNKVLDDSALRIVKLSAPFQPLPADIRKTTDILEIIRTWRFNANQVWSLED